MGVRKGWMKRMRGKDQSSTRSLNSPMPSVMFTVTSQVEPVPVPPLTGTFAGLALVPKKLGRAAAADSDVGVVFVNAAPWANALSKKVTAAMRLAAIE